MTVLALVRYVGSPIVTSVINRKLARLSGYAGHVGAVKLAIWRGAAEIENFIIAERGHAQDPPVVRVTKASISLSPDAFFHGRLGLAVVVNGAEFSIFKRQRFAGPKDTAEKANAEVREKNQKASRWQNEWRRSLPMKLTRIEVNDARVNFLDRTHEPNVFVGIDQVHISGRDLQNRPRPNGDPLPAKVDVTGRIADSGNLTISLQTDPVAQRARFILRFEVQGLSLPPFNNFLLAYANADVSRGKFDVFSEINAQNGHYEGYVKPFFRDLDFHTASDENKNPVQLLKKKMVSLMATALESKERKKVATRAPFSGNFSENDVDLWRTVANLLRNAFVQALREGLESQTPHR